MLTTPDSLTILAYRREPRPPRTCDHCEATAQLKATDIYGNVHIYCVDCYEIYVENSPFGAPVA